MESEPLHIELELNWDNELVDSPEADIELLREIIEEAPASVKRITRPQDGEMQQDIHCPSCGKLLYEDTELEELSEIGRPCPNYCGWVSSEMQGEDWHVIVSPSTY